MKVRTKILGLLSIFWMVFIFVMSAQSAENSTDISDNFTAIVVDVMYGEEKPLTAEEAGLDFKSEALQQDVENGLVPKDDIFGRNRFWFKDDIRKYAHFIMFFVLAVLINLTAVSHYGKNKITGVAVSLAISCVYGALDEFHQMFVPGRGATVKDILIDCAGAASGIVAVLLVCIAVRLIKIIIRRIRTTA